MQGQATGQDILCQLCDTIADGGVLGKHFAGITINGTPSMTGKKNAVAALVQRKLEEDGLGEAIALHCMTHQQTFAVNA